MSITLGVITYLLNGHKVEDRAERYNFSTLLELGINGGKSP